MTSVFIEPCDIVFFRDDLPFGAAGSQVGRCQFPPRPSVIAGALRTKVLASQAIDFDAFRAGQDLPEAVQREIGQGEAAAGDRHRLRDGTFRLSGLHLGRRRNGSDVACYRAGRDLVAPGKKSAVPAGDDQAARGPVATARAGEARAGRGDGMRLLSPATPPRIPGSSSVSGFIPLGVRPGFEPASGWLEASDYLKYLAGEAPSGRVMGTDEILGWDHRVGIALDVTSRTVDEGRLFSSRGAVVRDGWGFVAEVDGCSVLPTTGLVRLGGDGRMARLSPWTPAAIDWAPVRAAVSRSTGFRLVLQTPAIFDAGWRPGALRAEDGAWILQRGRIRARLVAAAVGAPELAGGWDLVRRGPKPFRLMAPAGSVYWFELTSGSPDDAWDELHGSSISDERSNEGFGLVHVGGSAHV